MNILELESKIKSDPFNPVHHIALARAYLEEGKEDKARAIVATKRKLSTQDPNILYEWGKLCEELSMATQARESYEQAIALNPKIPEYHYRIGMLYFEKGAWEKALKHLQKTISLSPAYPEAKDILASLYEDMGLKGIANNIKNKKEKFLQTLQTQQFELKKEDAYTILNLFQGREMGYARFHFGEGGDLVHTYINGTIGFNELLQHIKGEETLGVYPLRSDKTLKFCSIRVGIPWRRLLSNIKNSGFLAISEDHVHQYSKAIRERGKEHGFPSYLEDSGGRERRLWFFFIDFIPSEIAERFLNAILDYTKPPGVDLSINLLLGVKGAGIGFEDNPIMLPLGINRLTGKRCFFIDEDGNPYDDQINLFKKIRKINLNDIRKFLRGSIKINISLFPRDENFLRTLENRCPVIEEIIRKARSGRRLQDEEKKVIFFTLGFLKEGEKILHNILEACPDYRPNRVSRIIKKLKGSPISCPKIRQLMPERTSYLPCNCSFELSGGQYPTPILHIDRSLVKKETGFYRESGREKGETFIQNRYHFICRKIEELTKEKERLEKLMGSDKINGGV
jgi:hypothetical protein